MLFSIVKNQDRSCSSPARQTLLGQSLNSPYGINELNAMRTPDNGFASQRPNEVDVASPAGYVVSTMSSFVKGKIAMPTPQMARDTPMRISLLGKLKAILNPNIPRINTPLTIFNTKTCRLVRLKIG